MEKNKTVAIFSDNESNKESLKKNQNNKREKSENLQTKEISFDRSFENNIRPKKLDEYIGQTALKNTLKICSNSVQLPFKTCSVNIH